ncbi:MAG: hypothetical protein RJA57_1040 [Bacteroidota bacterium]|jgi:hypothetical protein
MHSGTASFLRKVRNPVLFGFFLFRKLPAAWFSGVRIRSLSESECRVSVPFNWFSQNPFRSTYFACLSMAAELSTGALAMLHLYGRRPSVSMLVVKLESEFFKKATSRTVFTCEDGLHLHQAIEEATRSGEARSVQVRTVGRNAAGETIAAFRITWSFKSKSS